MSINQDDVRAWIDACLEAGAYDERPSVDQVSYVEIRPNMEQMTVYYFPPDTASDYPDPPRELLVPILRLLPIPGPRA